MFRCLVAGALFFAAALLWLHPAASQAQQGPPGCARLLAERCTGCHYLSRVCQRLGKKSKRRWKRTVRNMVRYGARLSPAEQRRLTACLSVPAPEVTQLCSQPAGATGR